jgi:hypothetical protein
MKPFRKQSPFRVGIRLLAIVSLAAGVSVCRAAPTLVSTVPTNMATGVSPSAAIVFTYSEAMDTSTTAAQFIDANTYQEITTLSSAWSSGNTVLTLTPTTPLPANHLILWLADGMSSGGEALDEAFGTFTTAATASTGCDPNAPLLSFTVAKGWMFEQNSGGLPASNATAPYCFLACMSLPCPRDATNVSLRFPGGSAANLVLSAIPGHLTLPDCNYLNLAAFDAAYPAGDYVFTVQAVGSNQPVTVNFPSGLTQPAAPHLANFQQGQTINAGQPFVLAWDAFPGGTAADCIYVEIYGGVFKTPALGEAGALNGTATNVVIPAGTFQASQPYSGCVTFYHYRWQTNAGSHLALAYRASTTEFTLTTSSGTTSPLLVLTNAAWAGAGGFSFEVACAVGQALVIECSTNVAPTHWDTVCTTNSPADRVRITDLQALTKRQLFYRVRPGR